MAHENKSYPVMRRAFSMLFMLVAATMQTLATDFGRSNEIFSFEWQKISPLPAALGVAGPFAGVSHGALLVAGGANFPDKMPWDGGKKVWHDEIYVLPTPDGKWVSGFKLPHPIGYGVSVTVPQGVLCAGGGDANTNFSDVFLLQWINGKIESHPLPRLPLPMANGCGALLSNTVYLAGGIQRPDASSALKKFWALDLAAKKLEWRELEPWPGPARMLAMAGTYEGNFFLLGGADIEIDAAEKPVRHYLQDAYRYSPGAGWKRISDMLHPLAAAPSPAIRYNTRLLLVGGDDGTMVNFEPMSAHPGFRKDIMAYQPATDTWSNLGYSHVSRATVPAVEWRDSIAMPSGEEKPGVRSPEVWLLHCR